MESGGLEAFAHHLLTLDVSDFVPSRDIRQNNQAKREMIRESINPLDARKWLEACARTEQVLGLRTPDGPGRSPWFEGNGYSFGALYNAYVEWQKTIKLPVAPEPTKSGNFGEMLGRAGIKTRRGPKPERKTPICSPGRRGLPRKSRALCLTSPLGQTLADPPFGQSSPCCYSQKGGWPDPPRNFRQLVNKGR